jgi:hypothetical protein
VNLYSLTPVEPPLIVGVVVYEKPKPLGSVS